MLKNFILTIGFIQAVIGFVEIVAPYWSFDMWRNWVNNKNFYVHGFSLIVVGFPLIIYNGYLSEIIFYIGFFMIFTGFFIFIFLKKIREAFIDSKNQISQDGLKKIIYFDATVRIIFFFVLAISYCKTL